MLTFLVLIMISCNTSKKICETNDPGKELSFLSQIIEEQQVSGSSAKAEIVHYTYRSNDVFLVDICKGCPDSLIKIYNCNGIVICESGGISGKMTCPDFFDSAIKGDVIWSN